MPKKNSLIYGGFIVIALVAVVIYFLNSLNRQAIEDRNALLIKQYPGSDIYFSPRTNTFIIGKVVKQITLDARGQNIEDEPLVKINK